MAIHKLENYLKTYRKRAGISQREMDYLLGAHVGSTTSRYEHFKRTPTLENALACEALFHAPVRELFAGVYVRVERRTMQRARLIRKRLAKRTAPERILILLNNVDPTHRGFGYAIFEGPQLIDWGVRHVQSAKNKASLVAAGELISRYRPRIVVLEDVAAKGCRRCRRVRVLVEALELYARSRGLTVRKISQARVRKAFSALGVQNKDQMARFIAARFPELAHHVPRERKPWMSEDSRMAIFDAAAYALACFGKITA
jgi:transcriptional regulator with XRE-family HTH domain